MLEVLPKQPTAKGPAEWFTGDVFIDGTEGKGLVQSRGDAIEEIRAGDVITTPLASGTGTAPSPDHFMTHLSISEALGDDRPEADWGEYVTDAGYGAASAIVS